MISPADIRDKAERKYFAFLRSLLEETPFFPLYIPGNKRPDKHPQRFAQAVVELKSQAKAQCGHGYTIEWKRVQTKAFGEQDLPVQIGFESELDYLSFLGKKQEVAAFREDVSQILAAFPTLQDWATQAPKSILQYHGQWPELLKICHYFREAHQLDRYYLRELPLPLHTKYVEQNRGILLELLNQLLPKEKIRDEFQGSRQFEQRFGIKVPQPLLRLRLLDQGLAHTYFSGVHDLSLPLDAVQALQLPIRRVIILENKTSFSNLANFLTLPQWPASVGIFGSGFRVGLLKEIDWIASCELLYWGDIDVQGLQILAQVRRYFPHTQAMLMDRPTLDAFPAEWGAGTPDSSPPPDSLHPAEQALYLHMQQQNLRLEQEKISHAYVVEQWAKLGTGNETG